ncbi:hypothetical protein GLE_1211 [Lysobacter enzymogenes]|uniref:Uncharacterized protein n=1 Tax=Lysobacter enzymogenes TaxID=69 RepID=A0A0S2DE02_LYSEN|nr:hypothetical protein [Lysobacter enzymogenes]ALN56568.1 hypothetical protein GLE_1211 [Lysobacter enzymogenes]QCW25377.1 hypothetical protein FE772_06570 [Lysobacter enzymogenes]UZW59568.1 hypothetical protein BV903_020080 [Lysobacter enzymogenes]
MIRHWLAPAALIAAVGLGSAAPASARMLGGTTVIHTTNPVPSPGPWGGYYAYTVHVRRWNNSTGRWDFHFIAAYEYADCLAQYNAMAGQGWTYNPNPGVGLCQRHAGFSGMAVASPDGNGPIDRGNWSAEAVRHYDEGVRELREKYRIGEFMRQHELLIETIESMPGSVVEGGK